MATLVPGKIGKYDVTRIIGRGGMGVVYQATDPHLDRRVAIKMITGAFAEDPDMLKRFFREAQSLGSLQHPNIVTVFDLGDYNGNPYLVMEYLEGEGLDAVALEPPSAESSGEDHGGDPGLPWAGLRPSAGGNSPRHQAGQHHVVQGGRSQDLRFWHRPRPKSERDAHRAGSGHAALHGSGAIQVAAGRCPGGHFFDRRGPVPVVYRPYAIRSREYRDHDAENRARSRLCPWPIFCPVTLPEMEQILLRSLAKNPDERYSSADEFALDLAQLQGQLKEELIGREMHEVAAFLEQGEVYKAQGSLLRVLKMNQQHTNANRLLREVQQRIQRDEIGKQVRELRQYAEEALADELFDKALEHVDRALGLDRTNPDLQQFREDVRAAAVRAEKLHKALRVAEAAQAEGKLDAAKEAAEEALAVAPNDTQAKTLYRLISRDIEERARQRQMEGYLLEARQQISSTEIHGGAGHSETGGRAGSGGAAGAHADGVGGRGP